MRVDLKILPSSGYKTPLLSYPALIALMIIELWLILDGGFGLISGLDSFDYIDAADNLLAGRADMYRTPVYPALLAALRVMFGKALEIKAMQILQCIVAVAGACLFSHVALKFTFGRKRAAFWLTAIFALNPYWNMWVLHLMTEIVALTLSVTLLWLLVRDLPGLPSVRSGVWAGVVMVVLVFTRPILLCWVPVVALYFIWRQWGAGKLTARGARWGIVLTICVLPLLLLAYCGWMHHSFGRWRLSAVSTWNSYALALMSGSMRPEYTSNPTLQERLVQINAATDTILANPLMLSNAGLPMPDENITQDEIDDATARALRENRAQVARYIDARLRYLVWNEPLLWHGMWLPSLRIVSTTVRINLGLYWLFLMAAGVWLAVYWRRGVRPPGAWLCWTLCMSLLAAAALGGQENWTRLILPSMAAALMLVYQALSLFKGTWAAAGTSRRN